MKIEDKDYMEPLYFEGPDMLFPTSFTPTIKMKAALKAVAEKVDLPEAIFIRHVIDTVLKQYIDKYNIEFNELEIRITAEEHLKKEEKLKKKPA